MKVRNGGSKEIPLVQGKEQQLCFAGAAREEIPHAQGKRNPSKMVGAARGHQRADTLKPHSWKTSQSNHTRTTALSDLSTITHPSWVALRAWLSFIELDKGCGPSVIRLPSFLLVWSQCVCPLMPSCNTYHLTWVSLLLGMGYLFPWTWGISSLGRGASLHSCSSKVQLLLLILEEGYLLTTTLRELQRGIAPLSPPVPAQPLLLGRGVAPPSRHS